MCGNFRNITNFQNVPNGGTTWCMRARKEGQFVLKMNFASNISSLEKPQIYIYAKKIKELCCIKWYVESIKYCIADRVSHILKLKILFFILVGYNNKNISLGPKNSVAWSWPDLQGEEQRGVDLEEMLLQPVTVVRILWKVHMYIWYIININIINIDIVFINIVDFMNLYFQVTFGSPKCGWNLSAGGRRSPGKPGGNPPLLIIVINIMKYPISHGHC